jgi:6-phosphofructokinase 1
MGQAMSGTSKNTAAILFSGDAPGMNALLRSFVRVGIEEHRWDVVGVKDGFQGLVHTSESIRREERSIEQIKDALALHLGRAGLVRRSQDLARLELASVAGLIGHGGIILGTARCEAFHATATRKAVIALLDGLGVDALVVVGGEGSLTGAARLVEESRLTVVGIPATIDNDVPYTEAALGFDTAVSNVVWALERCNDSALSHHRIMIVQTMGRKTGRLAMESALAAGVKIVAVPEQGPLTGSKMLGIARRIEESMHKGQIHAMILVAEGVEVARGEGADAPTQAGNDSGPTGPADALARSLCAYFGREESAFPGVEIRQNVLGHLQRGGAPTVFDRVLAVHYAEAAWQAITARPPRSGVVAWRHGRVVEQPFDAPSGVDLPRMTRKDCLLLQKTISQC